MDSRLKHIACMAVPFSVIWFLFLKRHTFGRCNQKIVYKEKHSNDYNLKAVQTPRLYGIISRVFERLYNSIIGDIFLLPALIRLGSLDIFRHVYLPEVPTIIPIVYSEEKLAIQSKETLDLWQYIKPSVEKPSGFQFNTISDLVNAYRSGQITPLEVARAALEAIRLSEEGQKPMRIFTGSNQEDILQSAKESTERYKRNEPLSVFDGVPVSFKDNCRLFGCTTRQGISGHKVETLSKEEESAPVRKLREGGAIILGLTNMYPLGMGVFSYNGSRFHGTCRNPYNVDYTPSGSSSGAAAAVSSGINLMSVGADGGGSIRLPAGYCGVVGVKPSFGRVSPSGHLPGAQTVGHIGPLTGNVRDAAISYAFLSGPDENYPPGLYQPEVSLEEFDNLDLTGVRIGIDHEFFKDCNAEIYDACWGAVKYLELKCNAQIVDVKIPELKEAQMAHVLTIGTEFLTAHKEFCVDNYDELDQAIRIMFLGISKFSAFDYVQAQKQRTRSMNHLKEIFKSVDCLITPTFSVLPPKLEPKGFKTGMFDTFTTSSMMKYIFLGNLTGVPCLALPVGYGEHGLPISLQVWAPWYEEARMFRVSHAAEGFLKERQKPQIYFDLLQPSD